MNGLLLPFCVFATAEALRSTRNAGTVPANPAWRPMMRGAFAAALVSAVSAAAWASALLFRGRGERVIALVTLAGVTVTYLLQAAAFPARIGGVLVPGHQPWERRERPGNELNLAKFVYLAVALAALGGFFLKAVA